MPQVIRFFQEQVQKQESERARIRVLQGPEVGTTFVLIGRKAVIGRSEECEIPISDASASRRHAQIELDRNGWKVKDLGSANGILHNGQVTREGFLRVKDTIEIGETILEFIPSDAENLSLLETPLKDPLLKLNEKRALEDQRLRVRQLAYPKSRFHSERNKSAGANKIVILVAGVGVVFYLFQDQILSKSSSSNSSKNSYSKREPSSFEIKTQTSLSSEFTRSVDTFFKSGFREYREGNLLRAKYQFEMALQIDPNHALSRQYLQNTLSQVRNQVDQLMIRGSRAEQAGKLREAKGHFETVLRMLSKDNDHPKYHEAKQKLEQIRTFLGERGAI